MPNGSTYWERYWALRIAGPQALRSASGRPRPRREPCTAGQATRVPAI